MELDELVQETIEQYGVVEGLLISNADGNYNVESPMDSQYPIQSFSTIEEAHRFCQKLLNHGYVLEGTLDFELFTNEELEQLGVK